MNRSSVAWCLSCMAGGGLLLLVLACGVAQVPVAPNPSLSPQHRANPPSSTPRGLADAAKVRGLLWRVQGISTLYVLGSLPVLDPSFFPLDPAIEGAFARSRRLVVEVNVAPGEKEFAAERLVRAARYSEPDTLKSKLSPGTWESLSAALGSEQARDALMGFRPWFIAMNLEFGRLESLGVDADQSLEAHFLDQALGRALVSLTTPDAQVRELQTLGDELAERRLQSVLVNLPRMKQELEAASSAWHQRRAEGVARALDGRLRTDFPDVFARLWLSRCQSFARSLLEQSAQPGNTFVVVDVSLLVGEGGMLAELEGLGLRVEQL